MEEIEKMLNEFLDIEESLFVHYSEIPDKFEDDLSFIGSIDAEFYDELE
jgi:hypothetical protein